MTKYVDAYHRDRKEVTFVKKVSLSNSLKSRFKNGTERDVFCEL